MNLLIKLVVLFQAVFWACPVESAWYDVKDDVAHAAHVTDVDVVELAAVGYLESSFRPSVKAKSGSAMGLMQITKPTWIHLVKTYGKEYGITLKTPRTDPVANAVMAAAYLKEGRGIMERRLGRKVSMLEVYLGHKFGPYRATNLLTTNRNTPLVDFYPGAASRNHNVYYHRNGTPKTVGDVVAMFSRRLNYAVNVYGQRAIEALGVIKQREYAHYAKVFEQGQKDCVPTYPSAAEIMEAVKSNLETDPSRMAFLLKSARPDTVENYYYYAGYSGCVTSGRKWRGHLV